MPGSMSYDLPMVALLGADRIVAGTAAAVGSGTWVRTVAPPPATFAARRWFMGVAVTGLHYNRHGRCT